MMVVKLSELKRGDIVRHVSSSESCVVTEIFGNHATAVRTVDISQPSEWLVIPQTPSRPKITERQLEKFLMEAAGNMFHIQGGAHGMTFFATCGIGVEELLGLLNREIESQLDTPR